MVHEVEPHRILPVSPCLTEDDGTHASRHVNDSSSLWLNPLRSRRRWQ